MCAGIKLLTYRVSERWGDASRGRVEKRGLRILFITSWTSVGDVVCKNKFIVVFSLLWKEK